LSLTTAERRQRGQPALASVGLGDRLTLPASCPASAAGGDRAGAVRAAVLLADSRPNLDEDTRDEIMDLLEGLWRAGLTLIVVTTRPSPPEPSAACNQKRGRARSPDRLARSVSCHKGLALWGLLWPRRYRCRGRQNGR
jgi:predicted ABC-type transport system involved in lysophospholipase L1 biosynthesis ATPase subunit